ncbi:dTDP-4-dehydrorhamnose reductase [Hathewaya proteolytica DSM 3090]|uniref:dTDP-4-dehydrorhamnose reductase n=1 Tax=Hathewaya proteolytica DSM 3090 TaxID=1121331 RepID=A0A1M6PJF6_9CLOT|nr:dTDP-4-dehydrorhamnose reductase [Hathewaya proteolytica]SHK08092.1 dTDP-4-dehydrorhamnose reductase [Hathewaya proteolytica DSM 3090]
MKIIITGANGQLASEIKRIYDDKRSALGAINKDFLISELIFLDKDQLDISNEKNVEECLFSIRPNVVINCAAYTNVDGCETNQELAFKVNSLGPKNLARMCEILGAKLIHISSDYVYNGQGNEPFREYDLESPVSIYGKTKLLGDKYVQQFSSKYFIVRTSWVYGTKGKNFVYTIINKAKETGKLKVVNDQFGSPTNAEDLAYHIAKLISSEEYGVYHCTGNNICTWYDFACAIIKYTNIPCDISPCATGEFKTVAKRPAYSYLDNMMMRNTVGDDMRNWEDALCEFLDRIK